MPRKLKNHILNFIRFAGMYIGGSIVVGSIGTIVEPNHYNLINIGMKLLLIGFVSWFCWRFYTGIYRDGDFFIED